MPILTCPTCGSKLEVAADDIGHVVQCGSCQQTFTAEDPTEKKNDGASRKPYTFKDRRDDEDDRPSRRRDDDDEEDRPPRRRRDDDEDEDPDERYRRRSRRGRDDDDDYERRYGAAPKTGLGIASMCLGIASIVMLCLFAFVTPITATLGIVFGVMSLKTAGRGMGIAGIITSIVAIILGVIGAVVYVIFVIGMINAGPGGGPGAGPGPGGGGGGRF